MLLKSVSLYNYRNFKDSKLQIDEKTLVIGANDIGKTNLLYALRLLLDRTLSENDLYPEDEDFCLYQDDPENYFSVTLHFVEAKEECILSSFREFISETDEIYLKYIGSRSRVGGKKDYQLFVGPSLYDMKEISSRFYLKALNIRYISATRQIDQYLRKQKNSLIEFLQDARTEEEELSDNESFSNITTQMKEAEDELNSLSFVEKAGETINKQLRELSEHHQSQYVKLGVDLPTNEDLFQKVRLQSSIEDNTIQLGGEGRKNQTFIALWSALNQITIQDGQPEEVSIFCIEEPESHLHPHQQRKLSQYLVDTMQTQVILTSHSPYIACEFNPASIMRLHTMDENQATVCNQNGVSDELGEQVRNMEYRLTPLIAEVYFSDCVLLVEGTSEVVFYKNLANELNVDIDQLNISILSVEGVGFKKYINLLNVLGISWVMRTDNDYQKFNRPKKPMKTAYYLMGIRRLLDIYQNNVTQSSIEEIDNLISSYSDQLTENLSPSEEHRMEMYSVFYHSLSNISLYLAKNGLEEDFYNSNETIERAINNYFSPKQDEDEEVIVDNVIEAMKKRKSTFMFDFLESNRSCLNSLEQDELAEPLFKCKKIVKQLRGDNDE